jgi:hypothetical protein
MSVSDGRETGARAPKWKNAPISRHNTPPTTHVLGSAFPGFAVSHQEVDWHRVERLLWNKKSAGDRVASITRALNFRIRFSPYGTN